MKSFRGAGMPQNAKERNKSFDQFYEVWGDSTFWPSTTAKLDMDDSSPSPPLAVKTEDSVICSPAVSKLRALTVGKTIQRIFVSFTLNVYGRANLQQKTRCMNLLNDLL